MRPIRRWFLPTKVRPSVVPHAPVEHGTPGVHIAMLADKLALAEETSRNTQAAGTSRALGQRALKSIIPQPKLRS